MREAISTMKDGRRERPGRNALFVALAFAMLAGAQADARAIRASSDPVKDEPPVTAEDREHWAWRPLPVAALREGGWQTASAEMDSTVAAKWAIGQAADAATLIRRVSFDLTGLPPGEEELSNLAGWSDAKYEALVDRLLASPRYGEHWAQWWLDLARYAETDGFEHDRERPRAWHYRDWVIAALNTDMRFDDFAKRQIAGDLMGDEAATGFLFSGPDMPDLNNQEERRHLVLNDIAGTVGGVFLGLTMSCAQCHDHPYDPLSQADFYRLRAFFDDTVLTQRDKQLGPAVRVFTQGVPPSVVFVRGELKRPGPAVAPAFPRIMGPLYAMAGKADRAALATRLASADNPLLLRAVANRVWQQHFGTPLAANPSDLGRMGDAPSHPALLDWLAAELPRQDWSLKRLHKVIVMSRAYRQAARRGVAPEITEPVPARRLTGEMLRDALLSVSGELNFKAGGESVRLPLPREISGTLLKNQSAVTAGEDEQRRRSIFTFARRNARHPLFDLFDRPDALAACSRRNESTTAPQALLMLNSEFVSSTAAKLAARLVAAHGARPAEIVRAAILRCLSRPAAPAEIAAGSAFLAKQAALAGGFEGAVSDYCLAVMNSNEFLFIR